MYNCSLLSLGYQFISVPKGDYIKRLPLYMEKKKNGLTVLNEMKIVAKTKVNQIKYDKRR